QKIHNIVSLKYKKELDSMKKIILMLMVSFVLILGACTETENKEMESIESTETNTQEVSDENNLEENENSEEPEKESKKELDQTLVDNDNLKAVVTSITKIEDKEWDEERYEISIEVDNKREDTIEVQAYEVSADDVMIDDMVMFSETVAGGKRSNATMIIENYEGELPEMENNLEFILDVFGFDDYDYEENHDVKIEF